MLCVATFAMCFAGQEANAQCPYGGRGVGGFNSGFGGTSLSIGYSSGYRGGGYGRGLSYGGFGGYGGYGGGVGRGVSINLYRPPTNLYRSSSFYGGGGLYGGGYGRGYGGGGRYHGHRGGW